MIEKTCSGCNKVYEIKEGETDDGFCSFDCWEDSNCLEPEEYKISVVA